MKLPLTLLCCWLYVRWEELLAVEFLHVLGARSVPGEAEAMTDGPSFPHDTLSMDNQVCDCDLRQSFGGMDLLVDDLR